jgi:hypothetical protein
MELYKLSFNFFFALLLTSFASYHAVKEDTTWFIITSLIAISWIGYSLKSLKEYLQS